MTAKNKKSSTAPNPPTHIAYAIRESDGDNGFWTRIGAAWSHGDNRGITVYLDAMPLNGRVTLRLADDKKD